MPESSRREVTIETAAEQAGLVFIVIFPFEVKTLGHRGSESSH
jgi:hypothetical protein